MHCANNFFANSIMKTATGLFLYRIGIKIKQYQNLVLRLPLVLPTQPFYQNINNTSI